MTTGLPNLPALRAFEAVVRHRGLAGAAKELSVTPSAISHRLKQLEHELQAPLFTHEGRHLALTAMGSRLVTPIAESLEIINRAVSEVRQISGTQPLRISMLHNIAVNWFLPRLPDFKAQHPDIEVRLELTADFLEFTPDSIDLSVRYSPSPWPGLYSRLLLEDRLTPLCSPEFLDRYGQQSFASQIHDMPLISSSTRRSDDWHLWFRRMGINRVTSRHRDIVVDSTHLAMQAAANSLGLTIAGLNLAQPMINRGALVTPFEETVAESGKYYIVHPEDWTDRPGIREMREWLIAQSAICV